MLRVKNFITGHHRHQILCFRQVDDIVGPARDHINCFNLISADFKLCRFTCMDIPFLNQSMPGHNNEQLPLGIMPVLPLCDPRFADIDTDLPAVSYMYQLRF